MRRRIALVAALAPAVPGLPGHVFAQAGKSDKQRRIALVPDLGDPVALKALVDTLREVGRNEGKDFVLLRAGFQYGQDWEVMVNRAVTEAPDLIVAGNTGVARAIQKLLPNTPVVLNGGGLPVEAGIVDSLARPGRNVTGVTAYADNAVFGKYLQLLREAKPSIKRVGVIWSQVPPVFLREELEGAFRKFRDAARQLKLEVRIFEVATPEDVDAVMARATGDGIDALVLTVGRSALIRSRQLTEFAVQKRLPMLTDIQWTWIESPPLLSYGTTLPAMARTAAGYVDRILWGGAKPGDLPMQQPTKFELVVNLKAAKVLGITLPQSLLLRADRVIE